MKEKKNPKNGKSLHFSPSTALGFVLSLELTNAENRKLFSL
jgi:hypothetical protein